MNYPLIAIHWIAMFLALAGAVMLAAWLYQNLKTKALLTVIVIAIVVGLIGSYLTFEEEVEFMTKIFNP